jgi:hypothetical protein
MKVDLQMFQLFFLFYQVIVVLALIAVASAQLLYSGVSGPSYHNAFAASANSGIRRFGSTGGFVAAPAYAAAVPAYF